MSIDLDDITHIPHLEEHVGLPEAICLRYNPGRLREGNAIIGKPEEAKYGFTREQLVVGYRQLTVKGVRRFGLHTMVASNELNPEFFVETAKMLFQLAVELARDPCVRIEFVNLGGGIGIPYRPGKKAVDLEMIGRRIQQMYQEIVVSADLHPMKNFMKNGRCITGPYGYLVKEAIHPKSTYKQYIGVDACMSTLMRPGMYGAQHHVTVLGKENAPQDHTYDVVGSLCDNNDKSAIDRQLPAIAPGDLLVIHDAGAHGYAIGSIQRQAPLRRTIVGGGRLRHADSARGNTRRLLHDFGFFRTVVRMTRQPRFAKRSVAYGIDSACSRERTVRRFMLPPQSDPCQ